MSLILAIEPDRRQAARVAALAPKHLDAEIVVVHSVDAALEKLKTATPDLVLTPLLISARDDRALTRRLRELDRDGVELQTLVIPVLASGADEPGDELNGSGLLKRLRKPKSAPAVPSGCAPEVFASQIAEYLARIAVDRHDREHTTRANVWAESGSAASAPMLGELLPVSAAAAPAPSLPLDARAYDAFADDAPAFSIARSEDTPLDAPLAPGVPFYPDSGSSVFAEAPALLPSLGGRMSAEPKNDEPVRDVVSFLRNDPAPEPGRDEPSYVSVIKPPDHPVPYEPPVSEPEDRLWSSALADVPAEPGTPGASSFDPTTDDHSLVRRFWSSAHRYEEPEPVSKDVVSEPTPLAREFEAEGWSPTYEQEAQYVAPVEHPLAPIDRDEPLEDLVRSIGRPGVAEAPADRGDSGVDWSAPADAGNSLVGSAEPLNDRHDEPEPMSIGVFDPPPVLPDTIHAAASEQHATELNVLDDMRASAPQLHEEQNDVVVSELSAPTEDTSDPDPESRTEPAVTEPDPARSDEAAVWEDLESYLDDMELETAAARSQPSIPAEEQEPAIGDESSADELGATLESAQQPASARSEGPQPKKKRPSPPPKTQKVARAPKTKELRVPKPARPRAKKPKRPMQDEWGLYDPEQCGFAALLERLEELTEREAPDKEDEGRSAIMRR
jgi:CheY-like chemotaxis protein